MKKSSVEISVGIFVLIGIVCVAKSTQPNPSMEYKEVNWSPDLRTLSQ